uniref:Uncharacterized protein n=1 Tax=Amphimedon queenslandica TaxID=400682 RepID=A0A1X7TJR2_AMPQE
MKTLSKAEDFRPKNLPNLELHVILNSEATKINKIWRTLVDVDKVQAAYEKLKDINWLYGNLDDESLDDVAKKSSKQPTVLPVLWWRKQPMRTF